MNKPPTSGSAGDEFEPHCFPSIEKAAPPDKTQDAQCGLFQPMFDCDADGQGPDGKTGAKTRYSERIERIRQKGYEEGFSDGCRESSKIAKASFKPNLQQFFQSLEDAMTYHQGVISEGARNAFEMAIHITRQILASPHSTVLEDYSAMQSYVLDDMTRAYQTTIKMHPGAISQLKDLAVSNQMDWPHYEIADIQGADDIPPDGLNIVMELASHDKMVEQALELIKSHIGEFPNKTDSARKPVQAK
ncbi:MAG: hypothetical protein GY874_21620 [Desulfobacteraceae bacterium]|nr:hypothetical protein [Desulfobacteraceae bacterium]